jgi:hypothetical protein
MASVPHEMGMASNIMHHVTARVSSFTLNFVQRLTESKRMCLDIKIIKLSIQIFDIPRPLIHS